MTMATLQLYKNPYVYPEYGSITAYGNSMTCTPVGTGLRTGSIKVRGNMDDFMSCNYLSIERSGKTIYAWIDDVSFSTAESFVVNYSVDAWRTYRSNITLGTQFIERTSTATNKFDDLLGGSTDIPKVDQYTFAHNTDRVLVVQTRQITGGGFTGSLSSTPVQPSPYQFWVVMYNPENWQSNNAIAELVNILITTAESNVVTMYSIPYMQLSGLPDLPMKVSWGSDSTEIEGFKLIPNQSNIHDRLTRRIPIPLNVLDKTKLFRVEHSVKVVVPDAGVIDIPDQLLNKSELNIRQDIDLFSGASNYMLEDGSGKVYTQSVRGSSVSSIPVLSDAMDTYLSQNQNALTTSLIGDVATIGAGAYASATGAGAMVGAPIAISGINNIISRTSSIRDMKNMNNVGNPPAFLGTALNGGFNGTFWLVVTQTNVDNENQVHATFGYPLRKVANLTFPTSGYVKTQGCIVTSDGSVPKWAIEEVNNMFNNGVFVH